MLPGILISNNGKYRHKIYQLVSYFNHLCQQGKAFHQHFIGAILVIWLPADKHYFNHMCNLIHQN